MVEGDVVETSPRIHLSRGPTLATRSRNAAVKHCMELFVDTLVIQVVALFVDTDERGRRNSLHTGAVPLLTSW